MSNQHHQFEPTLHTAQLSPIKRRAQPGATRLVSSPAQTQVIRTNTAAPPPPRHLQPAPAHTTTRVINSTPTTARVINSTPTTTRVAPPAPLPQARPVTTQEYVTTRRVVPQPQVSYQVPRELNVTQQVVPQPVQPQGERSVMYVNDEERYRTYAAEKHGYGRNKEMHPGSGFSYNKRFDKRMNQGIFDMKANKDTYRNDPPCQLI